MSAFEIYMNKVKEGLKNHFDGNDNPPVIERLLSCESNMKVLHVKGWHPNRTVKSILATAEKMAADVSKIEFLRIFCPWCDKFGHVSYRGDDFVYRYWYCSYCDFGWHTKDSCRQGKEFSHGEA